MESGQGGGGGGGVGRPYLPRTVMDGGRPGAKQMDRGGGESPRRTPATRDQRDVRERRRLQGRGVE
jgi:hypothetical protein